MSTIMRASTPGAAEAHVLSQLRQVRPAGPSAARRGAQTAARHPDVRRATQTSGTAPRQRGQHPQGPRLDPKLQPGRQSPPKARPPSPPQGPDPKPAPGPGPQSPPQGRDPQAAPGPGPHSPPQGQEPQSPASSARPSGGCQPRRGTPSATPKMSDPRDTFEQTSKTAGHLSEFRFEWMCRTSGRLR
jgi:hypothetical protein